MTKTRVRYAVALAAAAAVTLTACSSQDAPATGEETTEAPATVVVENAAPVLVEVQEDGETSLQEDPESSRSSVEVPYQPERIVTFDIATLDTLDALGEGDRVVGIPTIALPDYLSDYAGLPTVGTLFEPDFEAVAELDPDLIVTAARSTGQYDALSEITTTIDLTGTTRGTFDPEAGLVRAAQIGEIVGQEEKATELIDAIDTKLAELKSEASGTALVLQVSGGEYGVYGEGSRFGFFYDLGFTPAVPTADLPGAEGSPHGDTVTNEFILTANPDWIFAFDRGAATGEAATAEETLSNELVDRTTAAQEDHIVFLPASELYIVINGVTAIDTVLTVVHEALTS